MQFVGKLKQCLVRIPIAFYVTRPIPPVKPAMKDTIYTIQLMVLVNFATSQTVPPAAPITEVS